MRLPASLHARLVLSHLLVAVISIFLMMLYAGSAIFNAARLDITHSLEDLAGITSNGLERPLQELKAGHRDLDDVRTTLSRLLSNHPRLSYTIYQPDGVPLLDSSGTLPATPDTQNAPDVWQALHTGIDEARHTWMDAQGDQILYVSVRIARENEFFGVLRLGTPILPALEPARRSLGLLMLTAVLVTIAVGLFAWLLANNLARPIQTITQTAERIARGDLGARVSPSGTQEMHRLAQAFNLMAARLQDHMDELRSFVANASHELRTPLTAVKLRAEALRDGALEDPAVAGQFTAEIDGEVDRLVCMVNDLLDLSRMEAGLVASEYNPLHLEVVATEVYETFHIRASRAGVELALDVEPELPALMGNEDQLRRVLYNFVDNAIKYTPRGGHVEMILQSGDKGKTINLVVRDTGLGIPREHLPHIFERFYRAEATRPRYGPSKGSGLGLAIAKTIIENHGGRIGVTSERGKGTTFWAELPALNKN